MRLSKYIIIIAALFTISVFPQKKNLSLKQATIQSFGFFPRSLSQSSWIPGTNNFSYVDKNTLIKGFVDNNNTENITTLSDINKSLAEINADTMSYFPRFDWVDSGTIKFWDNKKFISLNLKTNKAVELNSIPENAENNDEATNYNVAYTIDNNLYFAANGKSTQITKDENKWIVYLQRYILVANRKLSSFLQDG